MKLQFISCYKHTVIIIWLLLDTIPIFPQQQLVLPFEKGKSITSADTAYVHGLFAQADKIRGYNIDSTIVLLKTAQAYSLKANYPDGIGWSLLSLGIVYADKEDHKKSLAYLKTAGTYSKKMIFMKKERFTVLWYANMAIPYVQRALYDSALMYLIKGAELAIASRDTLMSISLNNRIAATWNNNGQYKNAIYYLKKAEQLSLAKKEKRFLPDIYNNFAINHWAMGDTFQLYFYANKALEITEQIEYRSEQKMATVLLANYYLALQHPDSAIIYLEKEQKLVGKGIPKDHFHINWGFSDAYHQLKQYDLALKHALKALNVVEKTKANSNSYTSFYQYLAKLYNDIGNYRNAYTFQLKYSQMNDSINKAERNLAIDRLEAQYRSAEKDKTITAERLKLSERDRKISQQRLWILGIAASAVIIIIVFLLLYIISRYHQGRQAAALRQMEQQTKIDQLRALMQGEENERKRIARELHDGIASILSAARMQLSNVNKADLSIVAASDMYHNGLGLLQEAYNEIRHTAHNLSAEKLLEDGLIPTLGDYCRRISIPEKFNVQYRHFGIEPQLKNNMLMGIYRVTQELLHNIQKHAYATIVNVQTGYDGEIFFLSIEDNGTGMDMQQDTRTGIGLHNTASRIAVWGGHMEVDSRVNAGTTVYMSFKLPK